MKTAGSSEMVITICQNTRVQIPEIHNPAHYIMPQLLDILKVTVKGNYGSLGNTQHFQSRPRTFLLPYAHRLQGGGPIQLM
jgi:phosphoheptose isomerase